MENQYKPVPDVKCLKYHGTTMNPDIKIFVSHRIDQDSETIDNPIYIPVRCGAIYDERKDAYMLGDDTGENISEKRMFFNELTVMYWAWKNVNADYYGMCHYRRYLSFSRNQHFRKNQFQLIEEETIYNESIEKYGLKENDIKRVIGQYKIDAVLPEIFDIQEINNDPNYTHTKRYEGQLGQKLANESIKMLLETIKECYPEYYGPAQRYYDGSKAYFCNCFVMKKELFFQYCEWLFNILFKFESKIDFSTLSEVQCRIPGFFSEDLLTIFCLYYKDVWKVKELQLVYFKDTTKKQVLKPVFSKSINIVLSSDDYYSVYMGVLIQSIIDHASDDNNYDIIILHTDISKENIELLKLLVSRKRNFSLRFTDISAEIGQRHFDVWAHYKKYNVYRLVAPEVLKYYDKVVYLDSDIVVNVDIAELFKTNLNGYLVAAVPDIRFHAWSNVEGNAIRDYSAKILKLPRSHIYFNSGVLVYNLEEFRKLYTSDFLLDMCAQRSWNYIDQDVLNIVCSNRVLYLSMLWNVMISADKFYTEKCSPLKMWQDYKTAHNNPYIVHYAGNFMPCRVPSVDLYWYFWIYARHTPFYELLIHRMIEFQVASIPGNIVQIPVDQRSGARKLADIILPHGSKRREIAKIILPKGSLRWKLCKQIYFIFAPQYRHRP